MGIQGFYNFTKNNYNGRGKPRCFFQEKGQGYYNYVFLDYHALFYNIVNLYKEVNYLIRLLYDLKSKCATTENPFFKTDGTGKDNYFIVLYIIRNFPNLFTKLGLTLSTISNFMPVYNGRKTIQQQQDHNRSKINALLALFPVAEDLFIDVIVEDIINHTENIGYQHLYINRRTNTFDHKQCLIFFDGIPSVAKMREQLDRRVGAAVFKYINKDIVTTTASTASIDLEKEMYSKFLPEQISIGKDTPVVLKTRARLEALGYDVNDTNKYGEAEHQIMKKISEDRFSRKKILLSSPDADLILLGMISLTLYDIDLSIYRETVIVEGGLDFSYNYSLTTDTKGNVSVISPYKRDIVYIVLKKLITNFGLDTPNKVFDISYLFLLLGDDFIPIIPSFNVKALESILTIYFRMISTDSKFKIINSDPFEINVPNLIIFLDSLKDLEPSLFTEKQTKHNKNVGLRLKQTRDEFASIKRFFNISDDREIIKKKQFYLDKGILLKDTTTELLIKDLTANPTIAQADYNKMIKNYLEGCQFIFDLYFLNDIKSYKWHYTYTTAPHLKDVVSFLKKVHATDYKTVFDYSKGLNIKRDFQFMDIEFYKSYSNENKNKIFREIYNRIIPPAAGAAAIDNSVPLTEAEFTTAFTFANVKKIFNCINKMYFNKCIEYDDSMIDPDTAKFNKSIDPSLLNKYYYQKYLKYKSKYLKLLEKD